MGDWDPFAVDESAPAAVSVGSGISFGIHDTFPLEGSDARVVSRDFDKAMQMTWSTLTKEQPWVTMPDPKPDLGWHKPTCTLEAWTHTDVKCELGKGVVFFTLNKPSDGNELSRSVIAALTDAIFLLHSRRDLRVAVFTGEGSMFCAGGDAEGDGSGGFTMGSVPPEVAKCREEMGAKALKSGAFPEGEVNIGRLLKVNLWHAWAMVPQFTICFANGSAMGDGLGLMTCCDFIVAVESAFFTLSDVKIGLVPAGVTPYIVARTGTGNAKRIFCTSENMSAKQAWDNGIVDEIVPDMKEGFKAVKQMCDQLTECGPRTVEAAKELILGVTGQQIIEPLMFYTSMMSVKISSSEEAQQGLMAAEKSKPWENTPIVPPR